MCSLASLTPPPFGRPAEVYRGENRGRNDTFLLNPNLRTDTKSRSIYASWVDKEEEVLDSTALLVGGGEKGRQKEKLKSKTKKKFGNAEGGRDED